MRSILSKSKAALQPNAMAAKGLALSIYWTASHSVTSLRDKI